MTGINDIWMQGYKAALLDVRQCFQADNPNMHASISKLNKTIDRVISENRRMPEPPTVSVVDAVQAEAAPFAIRRLRQYVVHFARGGLCEFRTEEYLPLRLTNPAILGPDGRPVGMAPLPDYLHVVGDTGLTVSIRHVAVGMIEERPLVNAESTETKQ